MASASINMFRQLGAVLGPSVLGTIVTTRFPRYLEQRLAHAGIPSPTAAQIAAGAVHGERAAALPPSLAGTVADSAARAFTDATHVGFLLAGIVLLAVALPAVAFVRHRNA
jgi:DHA2 family multidrug resistance protein-like MFS transporter